MHITRSVLFAAILLSPANPSEFQPDGAKVGLDVSDSTQTNSVGTSARGRTGDSEESFDLHTGTATATTYDAGSKQEKILFPHYNNVVVRYVFPAMFGLGLVANLLSFVTILKSSIRQTSTGVYLSVLALVDCLCLYILASTIWAVPVFRRDLPPFTICNIKQFFLPTLLSLSSLCVVSVTTDRFLAVWFPLKAKTLTTRPKAGFVLVLMTGVLLGLYLPAVWAIGRNCEVRPAMAVYAISVFYVFANLTSSYGPAIYLFCINIAISVKLAFPSQVLKEAPPSSAREKQNSKIIVTVLLVSVAFIVCSVPMQVVLSLRAARFQLFHDAFTEEVVFTLCRLMAIMNYVINFFLYIVSSSNFRRSLMGLFCACCGQCRNRSVISKGRTPGQSVSRSQGSAQET